MKTNVQSLTAEQKAQVAKNLDNFLTKSGATGISGSYRMSPTSTGINIGAEWDDKAGAIIELQSNVDWRKGSWLLHARNTQHQSVLEGNAEGSITWNGQSVVTSLIAKKDSTSDAFRFNNGLQIVIGAVEIEHSSAKTPITFPIPFKEPPLVAIMDMSDNNMGTTLVERSSTGFCYRSWYSDYGAGTAYTGYSSIRYIAFGRG